MSVDCSRMENALAAGADPNARDKQGDTPLFVIMKGSSSPRRINSRLAALEVLVAAGADVNARNAAGDTLLGIACTKHAPSVVRCLVAAGADVNARDAEGNSPLATALDGARVSVVKIISEAGGELAPSTEADAFCLLVITGNVAQVELALQHGVSPDTRTSTGYHCLHLAVTTGNPQMVELLLHYGAEPWAEGLIRHETPILHAVRRGAVELVRLMLNQSDQSTGDPSRLADLLDNAFQYGRAEMVRLLVDYGAPPDYPLRDYGLRLIDYALYHATQSQSTEMVELAISLGADVNSDGSAIDKISPLHCAADELCYLYDLKKAEKIRRPRPSADDEDDLFEQACRIFRILLAHGADPDKKGKTPIEKIAHIQPSMC